MVSRALDGTAFGAAMRGHFPLAPGAVYLNHGTVGVTPWPVLRARAAMLEAIERHPARFMIREVMPRGAMLAATDRVGAEPPRLRRAAAEVASFLGCSGNALAFVDNASSGVNAVLRSFAWRAGDELLLPDLAYGGVALAAEVIARERGVVLRRFAMPFPLVDPGQCVDALAQALTPRTRLALLDHVSSETAIVFPLAEMAALCRTRGVAVLADGAHAPGALPLAIEGLGVDWYAANLHKWAFAPRGCGVLWAAPERRAGLHPAVLSWGAQSGDWLQEFDWAGTRDPTPWLLAPAGIAFIEQTLGAEAMRAYNHRLAWRGGQALAQRFGGALPAPETMVGCMVCVPLPARLGPADAANAQRVRDTLLAGHDVEIAVSARAGALWARLAVQVYNDEADLEAFACAVEALPAA